MARRGSLSRKTYFPKTGDILEDREDGIVYECARANNCVDEVSGLKVRYAMLLGRMNADLAEEYDMLNEDGEVMPLGYACHDLEPIALLDNIQVIIRNGKEYHLDPETGTWKEEASE